MTPGVEIRKYKPEDFSFLKVLGKGSFGKVIMIISCNYNFYRMICKYLNDVVTNAINTYWNSLVSEVPIINIIFLHKKKVSCVPHKSITLYKACIKILILVKINQNRRDKLIKKSWCISEHCPKYYLYQRKSLLVKNCGLYLYLGTTTKISIL